MPDLKSRHFYNFNPRIPCGMRPACMADICCQSRISIHASHAGCDDMNSGYMNSGDIFQSTHPMRDATSMYISIIAATKFQSTHPMRDATKTTRYAVMTAKFQSTHPMRDATKSLSLMHLLKQISIHASHAGCDLGEFRFFLYLALFQSTHPMRDATR